MNQQEEKIKEEYRQHLDPKEFQDFKLKGLRGDKTENNYDFWFKCLYDFFSTANFGQDSQLLELGSGPTVHNVASACAFVPYVVLTEFVEANCEQLRAWLRKDPKGFNWTPFIERVAKAEGRRDFDVACPEIEARIRKAVQDVGQCDVLNEDVVAPGISKGPYDVVLSALTLETAAASMESYSAILKRIRKLIKPNGKLVLLGPINCSYWHVGNNDFHCLPLRPEDIEKALKENSYRDIKITLRNQPDENLPFDCSKLYFLTCTKY